MTDATKGTYLDDNQCDRAHQIWVDDEYATTVGKRLVRLLMLEEAAPNMPGLYETNRSFYTAAGLARAVLDEIGIY